MKATFNAIRTNENGAAVKAGIALGITVLAVAAGIWATKASQVTPVLLVVEDATETLVNAS